MKNEIFEKMHEKMAPREETVDELFARAEASALAVISESRDGLPSADNTGGIIMSMSNNSDSANGAKLTEVRNRKAGFAVAAVAALVFATIAGAYGLNRSSHDDINMDKTADTAAWLTEDTFYGADSGEESGRKILTEKEAKKRAMELFGMDKMPKIIDKSLETEGGVECYVFTCRLSEGSSEEEVIFYIPSGRVTPCEDGEDRFMTDTYPGYALTSAGIAHDGFISLCMAPLYTSDSDEPGGWDIFFIADGMSYEYMIDYDKQDVRSGSVPLSVFGRFDDTDNSENNTPAEEKEVIEYTDLSQIRKAAVSTAAEFNNFEPKQIDVTGIEADDYCGKYAYTVTYTLKEPWRRYKEDSNEYTVHFAVEDFETLLPEVGKADAKISLEEAEQIIMEQKGLTKADLIDGDFLVEGHEYFGGELAYVLSYEVDIEDELKAAEAKGEHYPYNFGIQTALVSAESGEILRRTAMTEYEAKQKAIEYIRSGLVDNAENMSDSDIEFLSVKYDSKNPNERYNFMFRLKGDDAKYHIIVPTAASKGPETDEDPFENEPVTDKALNDAEIVKSEYRVLVCAETGSGWRVKFKAYSWIFSYDFDKEGNITGKQCINDDGTALTETDMTENEARRLVLHLMGYSYYAPSAFSSYRGTDKEGEDGWTFEFTLDGRDYKFIAVYNKDAADSSSKFRIKDKSAGLIY